MVSMLLVRVFLTGPTKSTTWPVDRPVRLRVYQSVSGSRHGEPHLCRCMWPPVEALLSTSSAWTQPQAAEALATVDAFRPGRCSADCRPLHCSRGTSVRLQLLSFALAVIHRGRTSLAAHRDNSHPTVSFVNNSSSGAKAGN